MTWNDQVQHGENYLSKILRFQLLKEGSQCLGLFEFMLTVTYI